MYLELTRQLRSRYMNCGIGYGQIPIISETMARNRFFEIMKFVRFDYKQTRSHRPATDKLALISAVWYIFVGNCLRHYKPGANITVDE